MVHVTKIKYLQLMINIYLDINNFMLYRINIPTLNIIASIFVLNIPKNLIGNWNCQRGF